jgi:phosphoribosyl-ATP pyrophosphohydrolase
MQIGIDMAKTDIKDSTIIGYRVALDDEGNLPFHPYCSACKQPFSFELNEPFAFCGCGTTEWGTPRPAPYVANPICIQALCDDWHKSLYEQTRTFLKVGKKTLEEASELHAATKICCSKEEMAKEAADTAICCYVLAAMAGYDLNQMILLKLEQLWLQVADQKRRDAERAAE